MIGNSRYPVYFFIAAGISLLIVTARPVTADDEVRALVVFPSITWSVRPGTEIQSEQLGEFLAKNLNVEFGKDMRVRSASLHLEMISREKRVVGTYESKAVEVRAGQQYTGSTWINGSGESSEVNQQLGQLDRTIRFLGSGVWEEFGGAFRARECEGATHALRVIILDNGSGMAKSSPDPSICMISRP